MVNNNLQNITVMCEIARLFRLKYYIIFICTLISSILFPVKTIHAETAPVIVDITNEQPVVGEQLNVSVGNPSEEDVSYSYIWTIDNQEINCRDSYYVPTVADYEHWIEVKVYNGATLVGSDKIYFSKLPVVYIHTEDGGAVTSKMEYKAGNMLIQGNAEYEVQYNGSIQIKGRGNGTGGLPKKPYKIKLGTKTDLFGFGENKHWVLLANYIDESLLRNTVAYRLSAELGLTNMETTWVDVVFNDEYVGNYQLCEQIRVGSSRVDITDWEDIAEKVAKKIAGSENDINRDEMESKLKEDLSWITSDTVEYNGNSYRISDYYQFSSSISGGYLFELSNEYDDISKFTTKAGWKIMLESPEFLYTNEEMMLYVTEFWQSFEDAVNSEDGYNEDNTHYTELADFDSMIAYWLTMEIMGNNDAHWKSRYAYKDIDGLLLFGPVWDFDWGCGSSPVGTEATGWKVSLRDSDQNFYKEFIDDPYFTMKEQEKYWSIRPYLEKLIADGGIIDTYYKYLYESGCANEEKWYYKRGFKNDFVAFKAYMTERIAWLDEQFASQESIIKSLYTSNSANPYTKSDDRLAITLDNVAADIISANALADGVISTTDNLECTVAVNDEDTKALAVYVNGLKLNESDYIFDVVDGQCSFEVPASVLTEKKGSKNVISLIGKDIDGAVTYTNFASVIVDDDAKDIVAYDYPSGTPNVAVETDLENCSYPATSGALAADSTLSASVNGTDKLELIYSKDEYTDEQGAKVHVPVMAASETNL